MPWRPLSSTATNSMRIFSVSATTSTTPRAEPTLRGFKTTFTTVINNYARELGILKEKDPNFTGTDIRSGMTAVIL